MEKEPLHSIREKKDNLYKNLVLVALLSTGISLVANHFTNIFPFSNVPLWIGLACLIITIGLYLLSFYKNKSFAIKSDFVFVTDMRGRMLPIPRYHAETSLMSDLKSVFVENKAYETIWYKSFQREEKKDKRGGDRDFVSISKVKFEKDKLEEILKRDCKGFSIMTEAIEYRFLDWLSNNQEEYFSSFEEEDKLSILRRKDIPSFLLDNRIIEVLSKPIEQREKFINHLDDIPENEDVHYLKGDDNAEYQKFELKLPKNSSLSRRDGWLQIKNRYYKLYFKGDFLGFNYQPPEGFEYLYIGDPNSIPYFVNLELKVELNPWFFIMFNDWKYLKWIDTVYGNFLNYFSFDHFIESIGYREMMTRFIVNDNIKKINRMKENNDKGA